MKRLVAINDIDRQETIYINPYNYETDAIITELGVKENQKKFALPMVR